MRPMSTCPIRNNLVRPALSKTFNVVQEIYRHAPNNLYADVIFPAATWGEVDGVYISSERRINMCQNKRPCRRRAVCPIWIW